MEGLLQYRCASFISTAIHIAVEVMDAGTYAVDDMRSSEEWHYRRAPGQKSMQDREETSGNRHSIC